MKRQIRRGVYETNSSSTHSITMMMKDDYDNWKDSGKYKFTEQYAFYGEENKPVLNQLYDKDEVIKYISRCLPCEVDWDDEEIFEEYRKDYGFELPTDENEYLESYYKEFTTPSGEVVVAFGEYGYDG